MDCTQIKNVVGNYINHQLPEDVMNEIEGHFCICEQCRTHLSNVLEKKEFSQDTVPKKAFVEKQVKPDEKTSPFFMYVTLGIAFIVVMFVLFLFFKIQSLGQ